MAELFIIKTAIGRESQVMDFLASKARKTEGAYALIFPHGMAGYIIMEAESRDVVKEVAYRVPYVRGILQKAISYDEVEHLIEFKAEEVDIHIGDKVTIVAGPFKGEKAKVTRINIQKSEVILELLEAAVPIPITINLDSVKVIEKKSEAKE